MDMGVSINRWMDKESVVCVYVCACAHIGILLSHKKEWNNAICSNINGPREYDIAYMWNLEKMIQMTLFKKQK